MLENTYVVIADWSERSKQIAKIWRKLTPDEKQPYLVSYCVLLGKIAAW